MVKLNFPVIHYEANQSWARRGEAHGESYRDSIRELAHIRRALMLARSPKLEKNLDALALRQWEATRHYDSEVIDELEGIRVGAGVSITDLVILNNYTDFRDIDADEGCSVAYVKRQDHCVSGQTWDMHSTARDYVCVIHLPSDDTGLETYLFSLVGCVGMMGFNEHNAMVAINNLNTSDGRPGILWPAFVRRALKLENSQKMTELLRQTPVTSAHSYLLADHWSGHLWEKTPTQFCEVGHVDKNEGELLHTNHCLVPETQALEQNEFLSKTTHGRLELLKTKVGAVHTVDQLYGLLTDHDGYPKSICSHFESGAQDPSFTCGGAVADMHSMEMVFWRGCEKSLDWKVEHRFGFATKA